MKKMEKTSIKVNYDDSLKEYYFDIKDFSDIVNADDVKYYKFESINDCYILTFYDDNKNQILPKEFTIGSSKRQRIRIKKKSKGIRRKKQTSRTRTTKGKKTI